MTDIFQSTSGDQVTFTAGTPKADEWMKQNHSVDGSVSISFELPNQTDDAKQFRDAAQAAGFEISLFP